MSKEFVLNALSKTILKEIGKRIATDIQLQVDSLTNEDMYSNEGYIPTFEAAIAKKNMLERTAGFLCRTRNGIIVKLLQPYDSTVYTADPEELVKVLPAQWGFKWSTDPKRAQPFIALSTSAYGVEECCIDDGKVFRSKIPNNIHKPSDYPDGWEEVEGA